MGVDAHPRARANWGLDPMVEAPAPAQDGHMPRTGLRVKLREAWRTAELDESLARGEDPMGSGELTLRALKLCDPAHRARLTRSLEGVVNRVSFGGPSPVPGPTILRREPSHGKPCGATETGAATELGWHPLPSRARDGGPPSPLRRQPSVYSPRPPSATPSHRGDPCCAGAGRSSGLVIARLCIGVKDNSCVEVCPVDCIHPRDALTRPGLRGR